MIPLTLQIIIEFIGGLFLWWVAVYLVMQNPLNRLVQLVAGILISISFFVTSDIFLNIALATHQYQYLILAMKASLWSIFLPVIFLYHISFVLIIEKERALWQKLMLCFGYLFGGVMIFLETFTNLTTNYLLAYSPNFAGDITDLTGKYYWLLGVFLIPLLFAATANFYLALKTQAKFSKGWYKFFWPLLGTLLGLISSPIILLSYYKIVPHSLLFEDFVYLSVGLLFIYSIVKYDLFIEETKIVFGRTFLYSSVGMTIILLLYISPLIFLKIQLLSVGVLLLLCVLVYLIVATHPLYSWLVTFAHDLAQNPSSGLSVVNDNEVYQVLKDYNKPEKLEDSTLLRLGLIDREVQKQDASTPVDALRDIVKDAVEYFKPEEDERRRTSQNLKYYLLKMLVFDRAEEGQILWELGFEEYPLRIMTKEGESRPPLFKVTAPSDYVYTSRNAYLALKKEAIHNVAWRISYLEKLSNKRFSRRTS